MQQRNVSKIRNIRIDDVGLGGDDREGQARFQPAQSATSKN